MKKLLILLSLFTCVGLAQAQHEIDWSADGNAYFKLEDNEVIQYALPSLDRTTLITKEELIPEGEKGSLAVRDFSLSADQQKALIYTNSIKVWRQDTKGDYWVLDRKNHDLKQLGKSFPPSTLMFAKFSPDATKVAYVSNNNLYVEDISTGAITALTKDGSRKLINGTFDWAYEEEFGCRDGFRWSPDGAQIAFWQVDATKIPDYYMITLSDSVYSQLKPVEYPTAGQDPSPAKLGAVTIATGETRWMNLPGDPQQHYIPVMDWLSPTQLIVQQLNRKQNESKLFVCETSTGSSKPIYTEQDDAWISIYSHDFNILNGKNDFAWVSEKDGWRHLYQVTLDGKETLLTPGNYDVISVEHIDPKAQLAYFIASPENATQRYLYRTKLDGKGKLERVSPESQQGTHVYSISPNGKYAEHKFSNTHTKTIAELISLPNHKPIDDKRSVNALMEAAQVKNNVEFFKVKISDNVEMDGWMLKPNNFDPAKKYPVVFYVYSEPAGATVRDVYGTGANRLYRGNMADDEYIYISVDNRGTPAPKGREWRKSIYRKIGKINIDDQAKAAKEILKWDFVDSERVAV